MRETEEDRHRRRRKDPLLECGPAPPGSQRPAPPGSQTSRLHSWLDVINCHLLGLSHFVMCAPENSFSDHRSPILGNWFGGSLDGIWTIFYIIFHLSLKTVTLVVPLGGTASLDALLT